MFAKDILKVIYAPHKAFKEIIQNPKYAGPILIMVLFVIANLGFGYLLLSKSYFDQTNPTFSELDKWTEDITYWNSNATVILNNNQYINGSYYGNKSIELSSVSSSQIWARLNLSTSVNCSGSEGYKSLSFRIMQIEPSTKPSNVSIYLSSGTLQDNFYHDLTDELNETGIWNNLTIPIGAESTGWTPDSDSGWSNIAGIKLEFTWLTNSNVTVLVDGLFFHGFYQSALKDSTDLLINPSFRYSPISAFMQFTFRWVMLGGFLLLLPKILKANTTWKVILTIAGFILITIVIQIIVFSIVLLGWSDFRYSFTILGGVPGEYETAYNEVFGSIGNMFSYIERIVYVWAIALGATAVNSLFQFSWTKSLFVSAVAYLLSVFVANFLMYGALSI